MSDGASAALLLMMLALPLSALLARRVPLGTMVKLALIWAAIFAVAALAVVLFQRFTDRNVLSAAATDETVRVSIGPDGHFWVDARIDGVARRMLVDSGATQTALSSGTAQAAGLNLEESHFPRLIETANGQVVARTAHVGRLLVGSIETRDLPVIVADEFGTRDVLGMNFLSRLGSWRVEGRTLVLNPTNNAGG